MAEKDDKKVKKEPKKDSAAVDAKAEKVAKAKAAGKKNKEGGDVKIAGAGETKVSPEQMPRMLKLYGEKVIPALMKQYQFKNPMQVPTLKKVVINCAVKDAVANPKVLDGALNDFMLITGQRPIVTKAKKAIAAFKVRKGNAIAVCVTLRRARMWEFMDRLVNLSLPRVRDFKGVPTKSFDGRGNYSLGLKEQIIFPEISYEKVDHIRGMTITMVTSATKNEHARALLTELGMPFRK